MTNPQVLIFQILLFIKKTIKPSIFNLELQRRPVAANHLISYLKAHYDFKELEDLLGYIYIYICMIYWHGFFTFRIFPFFFSFFVCALTETMTVPNWVLLYTYTIQLINTVLYKSYTRELFLCENYKS